MSSCDAYKRCARSNTGALYANEYVLLRAVCLTPDYYFSKQLYCTFLWISLFLRVKATAAVNAVKADFTRPCKTSRLRLFIAKLPNRSGARRLAVRHVNCIVFTCVDTPIFTRSRFYPSSNLHGYRIRGDVA